MKPDRDELIKELKSAMARHDRVKAAQLFHQLKSYDYYIPKETYWLYKRKFGR